LIPYEPVDVIYGNHTITINDDDGTIYQFGGLSENYREITKSIKAYGLHEDSINTRWCAKTISLKSSIDSITFEYDDYNIYTPKIRKYSNGFSIDEYYKQSTDYPSKPTLLVKDPRNSPFVYELRYPDYTTKHTDHNFGNNVSFSYNASTERVMTRMIKTITFPCGKVKFSYNDDYGGINKLKSIEVVDDGNNLIKKIEFFVNPYFNYNTNSTRYLLDSCRVLGSNATVSERYRFDYYNAGQFPNVGSNAIDHWGYYNGANNNTYLIPPVNFTFTVENQKKTISLPGAVRDANSYCAKTHSLQKIYWTGGRITTFMYEDNCYHEDRFNPNSRRTVGGIRISSIEEHVPDHAATIRREFLYQSDESSIEYYGTPKVKLSIDDDYCIKTSRYEIIEDLNDDKINHSKTGFTFEYAYKSTS